MLVPHKLLAALRAAPAIKRERNIPLFLQGEMPLGLWMLESGELRVSLLSGRGRNVILEVLEPGDLAGLASIIAGIPYETGAQTWGACHLRCLPRADFLRVLHDDAESAIAIAAMLAEQLAATQRWIGNTTLARSGMARLVPFFFSPVRRSWPG